MRPTIPTLSALALLVLTACGSDATTATPATPATSAASSTSAASAATPAASATSSTSAASASTTATPAATTTSAASASTTTPESSATSTEAGLKAGSWASGVTLTFSDGTVNYRSNGIPNHERQAEYAVPNGGVLVPDATSATAVPDPTSEQSYDYNIPTTPTWSETTTSASGGTIGVMISGAALFNPYEGDGTTVATASNFVVKDAAGNDVAFLDSCNGHPTPTGAYHYHGLPTCVTATVDTDGGPSHLLGIAFDGYPIYGDRALDGTKLTAADLDECNGITSATPEFPEGIYHYVLLDTADSTSSIRCFHGVVDTSLMSMGGMGGGMGGPPPAAP
jgi:hypothetical protein